MYDHFMSSQHCIGERVVSIGQLLKRSVAGGSVGVTWFAGPVPVPCAIKYDTINYVSFTAGTPNVINWPLFATDYISAFGSLFAFRRGSYRIKNSVFSAGTVAPSGALYTVLGKSTFNGSYAALTYASGF